MASDLNTIVLSGRLGADPDCAAMIGSLAISNGLAWSPDGRTM